MKKKMACALSLLPLLVLASCSFVTSSDTANTNTSDIGTDYTYNSSITIDTPSTISVEANTDNFSLTTSDGAYTQNGNIYTITQAGTYLATGELNGQILIDTSDGEVVLELSGATITYDLDSPIKCLSADKLEISAKSGSGNIITDNRSAKTIDDDNQGEGAIYAKTDLKIKGSGTLVVTGNYNNGIHTSKDLTIQKATLKVTGYNNAIKGNNSVTITSGTVQAYAKTGNGIKTEDSDLTSKGNQKGTIAINGGNVYVDSLHDGIDASYNIEIDQLDDEVGTNVSIATGTKSTVYSKSAFKADSEKGLKAENEIVINNGTIVIAASDDAIHANYGTTLENGNKGLGNITINGGQIQVASGDDGLHADNTLTVNDGKIVVTGATEGYEANYIIINGGQSYIYGTDDGVNCSKKSFSNCSFTMNGGYLDVAVRSGDTDGIDSNGNVTIAGGIIITRGSPGTTGSNMSTGLDCDGTVKMTGGTLIAFNGLESKPSTSSGVYYAGTSGAASTGGGGFGGFGGRGGTTSSSVNLAAGNYTLSGDNFELSFTNDYVYGSFLIYSSSLTSGSTYTLSRGESEVLSWTQSSSSVTIS